MNEKDYEDDFEEFEEEPENEPVKVTPVKAVASPVKISVTPIPVPTPLPQQKKEISEVMRSINATIYARLPKLYKRKTSVRY